MSGSFCTMGGMVMHSNGGGSGGGRNVHRRALSERLSMPIILPDDDDGKTGDKHDNVHHPHEEGATEDEDHDGMTHGMNHDMDHGMNYDHSSHGSTSGGMHAMNQGTAMYMDGFHSALFPPSSSPPPPCLNLFHPSWTLRTPSEFMFAMLIVTLMGMLVEACGVWRVKFLRKGRSRRREARLKRVRLWEEYQQRLRNDAHEGEQVEFRTRSQTEGMERDASDISDDSGNPPPDSANSTNRFICPAMLRRARRIVPKRIPYGPT